LDDLNGLQRVFQTFTKEELVLVPNGEAFRLCGVVEDVQKRISKKTNRPWIAFTLSNKTELYNLQFFPETFDAFGEIIQPGNVILVEGNIRKTADNVQLNIARAYDFKKSFSSFIEVYHWILKPVTEAEDFLKKLEQHLQTVEGNAELKVSFHLNPNYALEGTLPFCCKTNFTLEQLKKFHNHPAVYGLELKVKDVPDYRQFARNRNGNNGDHNLSRERFFI
jgi:DNA polymerase-3 subunit alpha